jgi:hypothetical protein
MSTDQNKEKAAIGEEVVTIYIQQNMWFAQYFIFACA